MTAQAKIPKIRFKGFVGAWEKSKLGCFGRVAMNKRVFKDQTTNSGDIPFYKIGTFGEEPDAFISRELFEEYRGKYPYPKIGDILISAAGTIGKTVEYFGLDEYFQDSNIVWLAHDGRLKNAFLKYFYSIARWTGLEGSTLQRLYNSVILDTEINLPTDETEQTRIGSFFAELDRLIAQMQAKLDKTKNLKKAMLAKMFPQKGETVPKIRFKGFSEEWEEVLLHDFGKSTGGTSIESEFNQDGIYKVISIGSYSENSKYIDQGIRVNRNERIQSKVLSKDDLTMILNDKTSNGRIIGRVLLIEADDCYVYNQRTQRIEINKESYLPEFVYQLLNADINRNKIIKKAQGNTQIYVNWSTISQVEIWVTLNIQEQKHIGAFFAQLDELLALYTQQLEKLKNLKAALLAKMFV